MATRAPMAIETAAASRLPRIAMAKTEQAIAQTVVCRAASGGNIAG